MRQAAGPVHLLGVPGCHAAQRFRPCQGLGAGGNSLFVDRVEHLASGVIAWMHQPIANPWERNGGVARPERNAALPDEILQNENRLHDPIAQQRPEATLDEAFGIGQLGGQNRVFDLLSRRFGAGEHPHDREGQGRQHQRVHETERGAAQPIEQREPGKNPDRAVEEVGGNRGTDRDRNERHNASNDAGDFRRNVHDLNDQRTDGPRHPERQHGANDQREHIERFTDETSAPAPHAEHAEHAEEDEVDHAFPVVSALAEPRPGAQPSLSSPASPSSDSSTPSSSGVTPDFAALRRGGSCSSISASPACSHVWPRTRVRHQ